MNKKKVGKIILIVIFVLFVIYFAFPNSIKAYRMGIDVKYLDNPKYCEQDSDCILSNTLCGAVNKYDEKERGIDLGSGCMKEICGISCLQNKCYIEECNKR